MTVERRFALIGHTHGASGGNVYGTTGDWWDKDVKVQPDGVMEIGRYIDFHETADHAGDFSYRLTSTSGRLYTSGDVQTLRLLAQGETNALPALGFANASTSLVLGYGSDFAYGLLAGVLGSGNAWIQAARFDGTATAYNLELQPLGGGVLIGGNGVFHAGNVVDANAYVFNNAGVAHGDVTDFNSVTHFGPKFIQGYGNAPIAAGQWYSLGMGLGSEYAWGTYQVQLAWPRDIAGNVNPAFRVMEAGTWTSWRIQALTNHTNTFTASNYFAGSFLKTSGSQFDFFSGPESDTVYARYYGGLTSLLRGYVYGDGDGFGLLGSNGGWAVRIPHGGGSVYTVGNLYSSQSVVVPSGYSVWLDGGSSVYLTDRSGSTYGSISVAGSRSGWSGIYFLDGYQDNGLMVSGSDNAWGLYSESGGWKTYYNGLQWFVQGSTKAVPYCDWGGGGKMTASTGTPSGGSNGDIHFQYT